MRRPPARTRPAQATAQLTAQKSEFARLDEALSVARSLDARLGDEVKRTRSALATANARSAEIEKEVAGLREVAASTVDEARSLGEQLMAALADNRQLAAALSDLRAARICWMPSWRTRRRPRGQPRPPRRRTRRPKPRGIRRGYGGRRLVRRRPGERCSPGWKPAAMPCPKRAAVSAGSRQSPSSTAPRSHPAEPSCGRRRRPSLAIVAAFDPLSAAGASCASSATPKSSGDAGDNLQLSTGGPRPCATHSCAIWLLRLQRVLAEGKGEADPVASNGTVDGRRTNRRVEVRIEP